MPVNRLATQYAYGLGDNLLQMPPLPIISVRAPGTRDLAELGTTWVDTTAQSVYILAAITAGTAVWTTSPASGVGLFTGVTVNPGDIDVTAGDINIALGNFNIATGNATIAGDLTVGGVTTITGDLDLTSAALIDFVSTANLDPSILLQTNGGVVETLQLTVSQGTAVDSLDLNSVAGGITLDAGLASADAINITASAGGVDIDGALQVNIASSRNTADAIVLSASAGGIDILAAGAAAEDIDIVNTAGSVNITSGEVIANSMVLTSAGGLDFTIAGTGGLDIDMVNSAGSINISAAQAVADAIVINASDAAGGVQIQAGSNGVLIGDQADCAVLDLGNVVPTSARTTTINGGAIGSAIADTLDLGVGGVTFAGSSKVVNINTGSITLGTGTTNIASGNRVSGTHTVNISTGTGTKVVNFGNADGLSTVNIDAITLINDSINVATSINTGTSTGGVAIGNALAGAMTIDTAAGISLDAATVSNFTVTGAGADLNLGSVGGSVLVSSTENVAQAIRLHANGGVLETIELHADQSTAVASINLLSDLGGITLRATGNATADALNLEAPAGGLDVNAALQINIDSAQAAVADSVRIVASAADGGIDVDAGTGGITIDSTGAISIDAAAASNVTVTGASFDLTLASTAGSVIINGGEAVADAVRILSAAGGLDVDVALQMNLRSTQNAADSIVVESTLGGIDILASGAGAGEDIDIIATGSSVNVTSTESIANAIVLTASGAAGGIDLTTGGGSIDFMSTGFLTSQVASATDATGPAATAAVTIDANVGIATMTGFTTAAGSTIVLTLTNAKISTTSGILATASNEGANDAQMEITRIKRQAGSAVITLKNNGAAALNGAVSVTFWVVVTTP
jgi:hypothetical protein